MSPPAVHSGVLTLSVISISPLQKIEKLREVDEHEFQARFPILLNQLLEVLAMNPDPNIRAEAFKTFIHLIKRYRG